MTVMRKMHNKQAHLPSEVAMNSELVQRSVWIVPALFCVMCDVNDGRYLPANKARESENLRKNRMKSIEFYQTASSSSATSFRHISY